MDETSVKTNRVKTTGWAPRGQRPVDHTPFGHWRPQTFIGALRQDRRDAPWVIDGAMNGPMFDLSIETQLVPTPCGGDVVILDNLSSLQSPARHRRVVLVPVFGENAPLAPFLLPPTPVAQT